MSNFELELAVIFIIFISTSSSPPSRDRQEFSSTGKFYLFIFEIDIEVVLCYFTMVGRGLRVCMNLLQKLDHVSKDHYT